MFNRFLNTSLQLQRFLLRTTLQRNMTFDAIIHVVYIPSTYQEILKSNNLYYVYTRTNHYGFMSQITKNGNYHGLRLH